MENKDFLPNHENLQDEPVIKLVDNILLDAIHQKASDIHFEPYESQYRVRYRQDGMMTEVASPPLNMAARITARIKILASMNIAERRLPQDGRFQISISDTHSIDFRVNSCPTINGEKIAIRILDTDMSTLNIDNSGLNPIQKSYFMKAIHKPQGMILVTGPTGSGKTMTLYAALHLLNTGRLNIVTAEDPVEMKLNGINQVQINPKAGLFFSDALRAFMRQDPDVIMVGEIRDPQTAEIAMKASQTGHLVLSTLHTNNAVETLIRLLNMGIPSFHIAGSIQLIIAQRLVRKLCDYCKIREKTEHNTGYKASECEQCHQGYRGRIGLFEVLVMTENMHQMILAGSDRYALLQQARKEGMTTLYESGLDKVRNGITTREEVERVTIE